MMVLFLSGRIWFELKYDSIAEARAWIVRLGHAGFGEGNKRSLEVEER